MSLRRFRPYFRHLLANRRSFAAAVFYGLIFGAASGLGLPAVVNYAFPPIFDRSDGGLPLATVIQIALSIPLLFLLRAVSGYLNSYYVALTGTRVLEAIRLEYFRKLQLLPLSFVQNRRAGDLISRGLADTAQLQATLTVLANDGVKQPMALVGALGFLIWQAFVTEGVGLVLLGVATVPLLVLPIRYVGRKIVKRAEHMQAQLGGVTSHFSENLAAAREVRAFGLEEREAARFGAATNALVLAQMRIAKYAQALTPAIEFLSAIGITATMVIAYGGGVKLETFMAIVAALYMAYEPVKKLGAINNELKRGEASLDRLEYVLHEPVSIADPAQPAAV
ncbi:MAG: ABC transporter ATP-binding protein, partial [Opitutus sp.]|nr:ABC transporter ATP-binding protein [Opitutus sp.]